MKRILFTVIFMFVSMVYLQERNLNYKFSGGKISYLEPYIEKYQRGLKGIPSHRFMSKTVYVIRKLPVSFKPTEEYEPFKQQIIVDSQALAE